MLEASLGEKALSAFVVLVILTEAVLVLLQASCILYVVELVVDGLSNV
jgi:hypothetical protein